jgi:ABC-2 type transport system permease protein
MIQSDTPKTQLPVRQINGINWIGLQTLIAKEVGRFLNVYTQTIVAPIVTTLLFYTVFALAFGGVARQVGDVPYLQFLAPGLLMMTMVQNAFANTSSSLVIAKVQGNIVDLLMPPLSPGELIAGFVFGGVFRGLMVGLAAGIVIALFVPLQISSIPAIIAYAILGTMMLSCMGIAGGIWSQKFDHIAAVTNFVVTPLTFLSGTFYAMSTLPPFWQFLGHYNPFFYMIDGFRYGFIGQADGNLTVGLITLVLINLFLIGLCYWMVKTGYKIKT